MAVARKAGLEALHSRLRDLILSGALVPGTAISQVQLARDLGVSRTPLREVLRMLQQEGLVVADPHRRVRIAPLDLNDLEYVYTHRIFLESLGVSLTAQRRTQADLDALDAALAEMYDAVETGDPNVWDPAHTRFHRSLVSQASGQLLDAIVRLQERAQSYRRLYARVLSGSVARWPVAMVEHESIVVAVREHDALVAAERLAKHLGRTALTLIAELVPEHDPTVVRSSLQMVVRGDLRLTALDHLPSDSDGSLPSPFATLTKD
jgi:DNA-binding GntR family transcriptional regulator